VLKSGAMAILLAVRFLAELGMLGALAWGGWSAPANPALSVVLAVLLPLLAALAWGRWVAPKAGHRLPDPGRLGIEIALFAAALLAAAKAEPQPSGAVFGVVVWLAFLLSMPARRAEI
jgi:hypothetical protein